MMHLFRAALLPLPRRTPKRIWLQEIWNHIVHPNLCRPSKSSSVFVVGYLIRAFKKYKLNHYLSRLWRAVESCWGPLDEAGILPPAFSSLRYSLLKWYGWLLVWLRLLCFRLHGQCESVEWTSACKSRLTVIRTSTYAGNAGRND